MAGRVGFIGLGVMGRPMARNLVARGLELVVTTRSPAAAAEVLAMGAEWAETPADVAARCERIITMLPDSPDVVEVVGGERGILRSAVAGSVIVDMSTISPTVARELAREARASGVGMVDAPVSGGDVGADRGTLSIMAGGDASDVERVRPLFDVLGTSAVHVGGPGAGQIVKACNQVLVALTIEAVSEALVLGSKAGVDPGTIIDVLSGGLARNQVMEVRRENFLRHDFTPGFRVDLHRKDLEIALTTGRDLGVALPVTAVVEQMLGALATQGHGREDHSALLRVLEAGARHRIGQDAR